MQTERNDDNHLHQSKNAAEEGESTRLRFSPARKLSRKLQSQKKQLKQLIENNFQKGRILAGISHDVRNPLHGIVSTLEFIEHSQDETQRNNMVRMARDTGNLLINLLSDILDYARLEEGHTSLEQNQISVKELLTSALDPYRIQAMQKGLVLEIDIQGLEGISIIADRDKLLRVLMNLIGNAVKFTMEGGVLVTAGRVADETPMPGAKSENRSIYEKVRFTVNDSGIGIPEDKLPLVFQAFSQSNQEHGKIQGGVGLGTSIASQFVSIMGGSITVESPARNQRPGLSGPGSTFIIELPVVVMPESRDGQASPSEEKDAAETLSNWSPPSEGLRILVAEDNHINRRVLGAFLERDGHQVWSVGNGEDAVVQCAQCNPDVVLMDIHMPLMDGIEASKHMRKELHYAGDIYAVSASADHDVLVSMCHEAGMNGFVQKPYEFSEIRSIFQRIRNREDDRKPMGTGSGH